MSKLNIFFETKKVGTLYRDEELVYSFSYSEQWLKEEQAFQLSLAMPLQTESFGNKVTLSFFENLLPEGEARDVLEKSQDFSGTYELLKNFGQDCAGAIIISPSEESPFRKMKEDSKVKIKMTEIFKAIEEKRSVAEVVANQGSGYLSIAGAQDKFVAIYEKGEFYLPKNGQPTTHIIKVPIYHSGVKESVYNEYYCMRLAKLVGFNVPKCEVLDDANHPLFVIERYDREVGEYVKRIHQQDFCQAQGFVSDEKYEAKGGPSLKNNFNLIKSNVTINQRSKALFDYLDWVCFNLLIGNNDSHSKNISLLLSEGKIELAPFYDLLCTAIYPKLKRNFSFKIGDRDDVSRVGKKQFDMVDSNLGLKEGTMAQKALEMSNKLLAVKDDLVKETKKELPNMKIANRISNLISDRCKSF
ncbi:type II toxin-antitoxin system HipA family toxin [Bacteriovoracaceae bacterium]|nr:type II toxin-antitoxin system HipA family toxin [Bacteriovoracaceae bacterium]